MKLKITILLLLFIALQCCNTKTNKSESNNDNGKDRSTQSILHKDNDLPPGTADIQAEIISYIELSSGLRANLKIEKVNNYGSAVPPLAVGSKIICDFPQSTLNEIDQPISESFPKGNSYKFLIKYQFGVDNKDNISNWRIIRLNKL